MIIVGKSLIASSSRNEAENRVKWGFRTPEISVRERKIFRWCKIDGPGTKRCARSTKLADSIDTASPYI